MIDKYLPNFYNGALSKMNKPDQEPTSIFPISLKDFTTDKPLVDKDKPKSDLLNKFIT